MIPKFRFIFLFLFAPYICIAQTERIPNWFVNLFNKDKLNVKYQLTGYLKPQFLEADFDGDGVNDVAALITERKTNKKGIVIIHSGTKHFFVFGAGEHFGNGGDNFTWAGGWKLHRRTIVYETQTDKNGDLTNDKVTRIKNPALYVFDLEGGVPYSGGIIYWDGKRYIWIQQGE